MPFLGWEKRAKFRRRFVLIAFIQKLALYDGLGTLNSNAVCVSIICVFFKEPLYRFVVFRRVSLSGCLVPGSGGALLFSVF